MNKKMPRRELFGPWLIRQINSNNYGVRWLDESRRLFRLPWKHLNMKNADERDYGIFKAWAICSGKYNSQCEDPPTWKTNFRCALNQVSYHGSKMFSEIEDHSSDQRDPHKIYRFNGVHHDVPAPNPNVATVSEAPSNSEAEQSFLNELNDEECTLRISPDILRVAPFPRPEESEVIEELMRNILLDSTENSIQQVLNLSQDEYTHDGPHVDQVYRQSTHEQWPNSQLMESCVINGHEQAAHREPSIHIPVFREQYAQYQLCNIYQNGYPQNAAVTHIYHQSTLPQFQHPPPVLNGLVSSSNEHNWCQQESAQDIVPNVVDQVIHPAPVRHDPPLLNGSSQTFVQHTQDTLLNPHNAQDLAYNTAINGASNDGPRVDQGINSSPNYPYHTTKEESARSSPLGHDLPLVNGSEQAPPPDTQTALLNQQRRMPSLTSWEVTIYYRGKEVLKENVSKNFVITRDVDEAQMGHRDTVQFPSTDMLVNHLQIQYTDHILSHVGKGLLLEVNPDNYKVYATRTGKSRVYWSLSESVETQETASEEKLLVRDVPTEIFDFSRFWEELRDYRQHRRPSPDYTIYMTFGQSLFEPVMRKFILVKLVPNLCTFLHQVAQQNGASSLHSEVVSLQISNGSSFNSQDLNGLCLMDLDFPALF